MTEKTREELLAEVMGAMNKNRDSIVDALKTVKRDEYVLAWPKYNLAAAFDVTGKASVVSPSMATVVRKNETRTFRNGAGFETIVTPRLEALQEALIGLDRSIAELPKLFEKAA